MSQVFHRLAGLETEYAIRFHATDPWAPRSKFRLYEALLAALHRRVLAVPAKHFKEGVFTASGGAVWFEAERPAAGGGLIEGATPECRGPRELLVYQRAQDELLAECAKAADSGGQFVLIKNDRDSRDNVYGAQENYEVEFAQGWRLLAWRAGLVLLFPLALVTWTAILLSVLVTLTYFMVAALVYLPLQLLTGGRQSVALFLFGSDLVEGRETCIHLPAWLETILQFGTRLLTAPLALALYLLLWLTAFRRVRRQLLPFLISRPLMAGAGTLDAEDRFQLADKAPAINCVCGFGGMAGDRPIFSLGHFFKAVYADAWFSCREYGELFAARQRLQLALGDSNMCETAEYLRVATTMLVLDAIEAGAVGPVPRLRRPIAALHRVCRDATLTASVPLRGGGRATALELQRFYLAACRDFLAGQDAAPPEAWEVLSLWERTLDGLAELAESGTAPRRLFGVLDWVTKQYLLETAGADSNWHERKKIDIRYHELSPDGYYQMLASAGLTSSLVSPAEIERAQRSAPPRSPATTRGHYIREFAFGDQPLTVNWRYVLIGAGWRAKRVRLARFGAANAAATAASGQTPPHRNVRSERRHRD